MYIVHYNNNNFIHLILEFRFQSARTAIELIEKAKKNGEKLPEENRFDSNCITPGTAFMVRLQEAFKHFVKMKLSTDPLWKHCRIILSGHEVCCCCCCSLFISSTQMEEHSDLNKKFVFFLTFYDKCRHLAKVNIRLWNTFDI